MKTFHQLTIALCVLSCAACSSDSGDESDLGTSTPIDASQAVSTDATGDDISVSNTEFDSVSTTDTASVTDTQSASDSLNEDTLPEPDPEVTPDVTVGPEDIEQSEDTSSVAIDAIADAEAEVGEDATLDTSEPPDGGEEDADDDDSDESADDAQATDVDAEDSTTPEDVEEGPSPAIPPLRSTQRLATRPRTASS